MGHESFGLAFVVPPERYRPQLSEKLLTEQCTDYLKLMHIPHWRMNVGLRTFDNPDGSKRYVHFGQKGLPDWLLAIPIGNAFHIGWLELKKPKGKLSPDQEEFKRYAEEQSMCYILARSVEDLQNGLESYKNRFV